MHAYALNRDYLVAILRQFKLQLSQLVFGERDRVLTTPKS